MKTPSLADATVIDDQASGLAQLDPSRHANDHGFLPPQTTGAIAVPSIARNDLRAIGDRGRSWPASGRGRCGKRKSTSASVTSSARSSGTTPPSDTLNHRFDLALVGAPVAGDRQLDVGGSVFKSSSPRCAAASITAIAHPSPSKRRTQDVNGNEASFEAHRVRVHAAIDYNAISLS